MFEGPVPIGSVLGPSDGPKVVLKASKKATPEHFEKKTQNDATRRTRDIEEVLRFVRVP